MTRMVSGGCCCGGIRYEYEGEVGTAGYCHCEDCRRISGSAFGVSVRVAAKGFRVVRGEMKAFTKAGESGRPPRAISAPTAARPCVPCRLCTRRRFSLRPAVWMTPLWLSPTDRPGPAPASHGQQSTQV